MASTKKPLQATVEDYFSDDGHGQGVAIDPFPPGPSPGKANVRSKRSNPEHMGLGPDKTDKSPPSTAPANLEVKSDSGYSSQSVAGMSSADSAASAASSQQSPPPPPPVPANASPTPAQRRPAPSRQQSANPERRYTLPSRDSQPPPRQRPVLNERRSNPPPQPPPQPAQQPAAPPQPPKRRDSRMGDECTVPGCTECGPAAIDPRSRQSRRRSMLNAQPADSAPDVSHPRVHDTRSQVSDPAQYPAPSTRESRTPRLYQTSQGGPVIQPAITRRLSTNNRQRPTSYHEDPNYGWQQSGMHSPHPHMGHEHGPPLSRSAWGNVAPYPQPQMNPGYMHPYPQPGPPPGPPLGSSPATYYQAQQMQPREQRPQIPVRAHTTAYGYPAAQPSVQVGRSDRELPSARYHPNSGPSFQAPRSQPRIDYHNQAEDDSESSSASETESEEEPEYQPQRPRGGSSHQRPGLRHANTTPAPPVPVVRRPQTIIIPEQRNPRASDPRSARRSSTSRPPPVPSNKSHSTYETPRARVVVENSRSSRRGSTSQAYDRPLKEHRRVRQHEYADATRPKRSSRLYENVVGGHDYERDYRDEDDDEVERDDYPPRRRRDTDAEPRRKPHRPLEVRQAEADAEDYITAKRGGGEPVADVSYEVAKRKSKRTSGGPSEPESSRSRGSENNGEIRLRIRNDAPVTLSLNGDMEGRTLQLVPIGNETNELVISSNGRGGESTYHRSETRSVRGAPRAIMSASQTRREAEERTERSSRSGHSRRPTRVEQDEPRRVLHRSNRRRDHGEPDYRP